MRMFKIYWILVFLLLLLLLSNGACNSFIINKENTNKIIVQKGNTFQFTLRTNPSTGYSWKISTESDTLKISFINRNFQYEKLKKKAIGGPVDEIWEFKALKKGKASLIMQYSRDWENKDPIDTQIYLIKIQ